MVVTRMVTFPDGLFPGTTFPGWSFSGNNVLTGRVVILLVFHNLLKIFSCALNFLFILIFGRGKQLLNMKKWCRLERLYSESNKQMSCNCVFMYIQYVKLESGRLSSEITRSAPLHTLRNSSAV